MFQGEWIPNTGRAFLRLLIDGVVQTGPGDAAGVTLNMVIIGGGAEIFGIDTRASYTTTFDAKKQ